MSYRATNGVHTNGGPFANGGSHYKAERIRSEHKLIVEDNDRDLSYSGNQDNVYTYEVVEEIATWLKKRINHSPKIGIICGSGMGPLAEMITDSVTITYSEIPHFPASTVKGHAGRLVFGLLNGVPTMCMQGRFHYYEGYPLWKCSMPVRVMKLVGVTHLIVTCAAGGLNSDFNVGDIMVLKDHINMMGFAGNNPLLGTNDERFGPRFPPMNRAYNAKLRMKAKEVAQRVGLKDIIREGVYAVLGGPNFETIAELKMLKIVGADAVGMSTVPEVITAQHCGMTVFALALITNNCVTDYDSKEEANHEEVMDTGKMREKDLKNLVSEMVKEMGEIV